MPMNGTPSRILLVDDAEDIRQVLGDWLTFSGYTVDDAPNVTQALALFRANPYDLVITDLVMPGLTGHHMLSMVKELDPTVEVIILTGQGTMADAIEALREGRAFDFLQKPVRSPQLLNTTIEKALARRRNAGPLRVPPPSGELPVALHHDLTPRELEIVSLIVQGLENREIGERLFLSEKTIKNTLSRIYEKLGVTNRTQAALYCQQHGLG